MPQYGNTAKLAKRPSAPRTINKIGPVCLLSIKSLGVLGLLACLAVFPLCGCRNKANFHGLYIKM